MGLSTRGKRQLEIQRERCGERQLEIRRERCGESRQRRAVASDNTKLYFLPCHENGEMRWTI